MCSKKSKFSLFPPADSSQQEPEHFPSETTPDSSSSCPTDATSCCSVRMPSPSPPKSSIPSPVLSSTTAFSNRNTGSSSASVVASPSPQDTRLNITTENVIRPRSECRGGSDQLKLGYKTKTPLTEEQRKARALERVKAKVGEGVAENLLKKWNEIQSGNDKKKRQLEGDGVIKTLRSLGFSEIELRSFLCVGSGRIERVTKNKPPKARKPPKHAATDEDKRRIVDFILSLDLEPGYPCAHRSVPLYIEGDDQGSTWRKIHNKYQAMCATQEVRSMSYNRFREYVHHYFPTLKLGNKDRHVQ